MKAGPRLSLGRNPAWAPGALELVKDRYRIFLTSGTRGAIVNCEDPETATYLRGVMGAWASREERMADLFEQLIADHLTDEGYLCELNVNYRKADNRQSGSDIDVLALRKRPPRDVIVADCKSWGAGFWGDWLLDDGSKSAVAERTYFKAIFQSEWAEGLANKVEEELGTRKFVYTIFCTRINRSPKYGGVDQLEKRLVAGNPIRVVPFVDVIHRTVERLRVKKRSSGAVEPTTLSRMVQLLDHARIDLEQR